jgi:hypothetical protein
LNNLHIGTRGAANPAAVSAVALKQLAEYGVITLDYDIPLEGFDYAIFTESAACKYFRDTVQVEKSEPGLYL